MGFWMIKNTHLKLDVLTHTMFVSTATVCLIVLIDAVVAWKAEIGMYFAAWWMFIIPN